MVTKRILMAKIIFAVFIILLFSFNSFSLASTNGQSALNMINEQQEIVTNISTDIFTNGQINSLSKKLENAKKAVVKRKYCTAANILNAYINETNALFNVNQEVSEFLNANGRKILYALVKSRPDGEICKVYDRYKTIADLNIASSDNQHLSGSIVFGAPEMIPTEGNGKQYIQLKVPGTEDNMGEPGKPGVPYIHKLVAVPRNADVTINVKAVEIAEAIKLNIFPYQYPKIDSDTLELTESNFVIDEEAFAATELFPSEICSINLIGQVRDLPIAMLACATGRYDASDKTFYMFDNVDLEVIFSEGANNFITQASFNPFEPEMANISDVTVNGDIIKDYVDPKLAEKKCQGEELLIFTPKHLETEANRLAAWKGEKGIATSVVLVDENTTANQIDSYIEKRFNECVIRPSYVILFGDAEYVPTFYVTTNFDNDNSTASDYPYAVMLGNYPYLKIVPLPSFGVGRIPVDTVEEAKIVVDKIISYEKTPPNDANFYKNISIISQFECCRLRYETTPLVGLLAGEGKPEEYTDGWADRANIETSEFVRNGLLNENYSVERIYDESIVYLLENFPNAFDPPFDTTPRYYYSGADLPLDIGPSSTFPWFAIPSDIYSSWNLGRFLILRRGHGDLLGWKNPHFSMEDDKGELGDLEWLFNGDRLPVLFGIACELAFFDNETSSGIPFELSSKLGSGWQGSEIYPHNDDGVYFSEQLIRMEDAGVIGLIGSTRISPGTPNNALTRGLFDAIWPDTEPSDYTNEKPIRRLGDILNSAKSYMISQVGIPQPAEETNYLGFAVDNLYLYHLIGDPTLAIWTSKPFYLSSVYKKYFAPNSVIVEYEINGAQITALQKKESDTVPIGRATVKDGKATIEYITEPDPLLPIRLSVSMQDAVSHALQLAIVDLENEDSFSDNATRITFDETGRQVLEHINSQYQDLGVIFLDDDSTTPIIVNYAIRGGSTHSESYSLANDADTSGTGSSGVPLTITFISLMQRAGMYIGNGQGTTVATLTAYDEAGNSIFTVTRNGFGNNVNTFIGIDAGTKVIKELRLDYGNTSLSEEIDDLMFE